MELVTNIIKMKTPIFFHYYEIGVVFYGKQHDIIKKYNRNLKEKKLNQNRKQK